MNSKRTKSNFKRRFFMNSKRFLLVSLFLLVALGLMYVGGQKESIAADQKILNVLFQQSNIPDDKIVEGYAEEWAKKNNVKLNFQIVDENQLASKTLAAIESKTGPDLILFPAYSAYLYKDSLVLLNELVDGLGEKYGGWFPIAKQAFFYNGEWKAIPYKTFVKPIVYRKDVINEAPDTWEKLVQVSKEISEEDNGMYGFGVAIGPRSDGPNFIRSLLWSYGASIVDKNGNVAFNSKEAIEAYSLLKKWYKVGGMAPGVAGWDDSDNNAAFMAGKIAMTINASSIYLAAKNDFSDTLGKVTGHFLAPAGPAGRYGNASTQGLGIPKYSNNKETAIDFLEYLYTPEHLKAITTETGGGATMMLSGVINDLPLWEDPDLKALLEMSEVSYLIGYPGKITRAASAVRAEFILINAAGRMIAQDLSPEETVKMAHDQIVEIYSRF